MTYFIITLYPRAGAMSFPFTPDATQEYRDRSFVPVPVGYGDAISMDDFASLLEDAEDHFDTPPVAQSPFGTCSFGPHALRYPFQPANEIDSQGFPQTFYIATTEPENLFWMAEGPLQLQLIASDPLEQDNVSSTNLITGEDADSFWQDALDPEKAELLPPSWDDIPWNSAYTINNAGEQVAILAFNQMIDVINNNKNQVFLVRGNGGAEAAIVAAQTQPLGMPARN